jgi:hypothetical protein
VHQIAALTDFKRYVCLLISLLFLLLGAQSAVWEFCITLHLEGIVWENSSSRSQFGMHYVRECNIITMKGAM